MSQLAGDHVQVLVGGYDLTSDFNRITLSDAYAPLKAATFGEAVEKYILGQRQLKLSHRGYVNAQSGRSHPVLSGLSVAGVVSVLVGQNAAPILGDPVYSLEVQQETYQPQPQVGEVIPFTADFANRGSTGGWGRLLLPPTTITTTTTSTALDDSAVTSNGGLAVLHLLQASAGDTYTMLVQGADNIGFTAGVVTVATFSLNASALGSQAVLVSGSVKRYLRVSATRIGVVGNPVTLAVSFIRF